ncbi:MAG: pyridoxamine 5'-phosphate oxidase [Alphaproteobacteria bacterium]
MNPLESNSPIALFRQWMDEAEASEPNDPNAMSLATATADGRPSVRMVLLKDVDETGFTFYTNLESRKGVELLANPWAALCFHWKTLRRQVRVEGAVHPVEDAVADAYFASRPRLSQIGAWASSQSRPLLGLFELERRVVEYTAKFGLQPVPRPPHWSGFRLVSEVIEFWRDQPYRMHERIVHRRDGGSWRSERLYP